MKLALENPEGPIFRLTPEMWEKGLEESRKSPRKRMLMPVHRRGEDLVQRMVNFLQKGTYIRPHQHPRDYASETIFLMSGDMGFYTFDDEGKLQTATNLTKGDLIDIEARVWHGLVALSADTVILEIKRGPYDDRDKIFADWAPEEGTPEADEFVESLTLQHSI